MDFTALLHVGVIVVTSSISPSQLQEFRIEASRVWQPYGVHLTWIDASSSYSDTEHTGQPVDFIVQLSTDDRDLARGGVIDDTALGRVRLGAAPVRTISLALVPVRRMILESTLAGVPVHMWSVPVREHMIGRGLGRVFAHELGHVLLDLPAHDRTGLMRPAFTTADLVMPGREHMAISAQLVQRLRMRLATLRAVAVAHAAAP